MDHCGAHVSNQSSILHRLQTASFPFHSSFFSMKLFGNRTHQPIKLSGRNVGLKTRSLKSPTKRLKDGVFLPEFFPRTVFVPLCRMLRPAVGVSWTPPGGSNPRRWWRAPARGCRAGGMDPWRSVPSSKVRWWVGWFEMKEGDHVF